MMLAGPADVDHPTVASAARELVLLEDAVPVRASASIPPTDTRHYPASGAVRKIVAAVGRLRGRLVISVDSIRASSRIPNSGAWWFASFVPASASWCCGGQDARPSLGSRHQCPGRLIWWC